MLSFKFHLQVASLELSAGLQKTSRLEERESECTALEGRLAEREDVLVGMVAAGIAAANYQSTREAELSLRLHQAEQQRAEAAFNAAGVARQQASV